MMQPHKKLYMERIAIFPELQSRFQSFELIENEEDAVSRIIAEGKPRSIRLYERTEVEIDGEILKGEPRAHTGKIYVGFDNIGTTADHAAYHKDQKAYYSNPENNTATNALLRSLFNADAQTYNSPEFNKILAELEIENPETRYIVTEKNIEKFIKLGEHDKVYDTKGQLLWPVAQDLTPALMPEI